MAKKLPKQLALLDEDLCTGCEACVSVCPVDCIATLNGPLYQEVMQSCSIDMIRCIGCTLCSQVCPWNVITMVPTNQMLREKRFADELIPV